MKPRTRWMIAAALLLMAGALAQTVTVPLTGVATLPDGTKVPFTGTGTMTLPPPPTPVPPALTLSSTALSWGSVALTSTRSEQLRLLVLTNDTSSQLTVTPQAPGAPFSLKAGAGVPITLPAGQSALLAYAFNPTALGATASKATLTTGGGIVTVGLSGSAIPLPTAAAGAKAAAAKKKPRAPRAALAPAAGPSGATGADVPLTPAETLALARRITVSGFTAAAISAACQQAAAQGVPVVYLPPGRYVMEAAVTVPGGLTLLGAGSATLLVSASLSTQMFNPNGYRIRFTRMKLQGWSTAWTQAAGNDSRGIQNLGKQDMRVDHCELSGFSIAIFYQQQATGMVDHCRIHDNPVIGQGYGVMVRSGSYVRVEGNEFGDCRVCLVSGDVAGYRPSHWEFAANHVHNNTPSSWQHGACDTHSYYLGSFLVADNVFDAQVSCALESAGGSGTFSGNVVKDSPKAIWLYQYSENGYVGTPHDLMIEGNTFTNVAQPLVIRDQAINIVMDGKRKA